MSVGGLGWRHRRPHAGLFGSSVPPEAVCISVSENLAIFALSVCLGCEPNDHSSARDPAGPSSWAVPTQDGCSEAGRAAGLGGRAGTQLAAG